MVILDAPVASQPLVEWLAASQHPVLANGFSRSLAAPRPLNLVDDAEAARRIDSGERLYTNSENALAWIDEHSANEPLKATIALFKDKGALRERLAPLAPGLSFQRVPRSQLGAIDPTGLPLPVVLKPSVGFCSMGVYVIDQPQDWADALADIAQREAEWRARYPESVVGGDEYLIEGYLQGTEYALDMYYDEEGSAHLLNVLRHDFAGPEDTSDRLYLTNDVIVEAMAPRFERWLDEVNALVGAKSFPVHVEVRVDGDAIVPIEFNPLRFAGLGGTDVAYYGVGLRTYQAYLEDSPVDLEALYAAHPGDTFSMSLLNPSPEADLARPFHYDALEGRFSDVLAFARFDPNVTGSYGFLFLRTTPQTADELDWLLRSDLMEFQG